MGRMLIPAALIALTSVFAVSTDDVLKQADVFLGPKNPIDAALRQFLDLRQRQKRAQGLPRHCLETGLR